MCRKKLWLQHAHCNCKWSPIVNISKLSREAWVGEWSQHYIRQLLASLSLHMTSKPMYWEIWICNEWWNVCCMLISPKRRIPYKWTLQVRGEACSHRCGGQGYPNPFIYLDMLYLLDLCIRNCLKHLGSWCQMNWRWSYLDIVQYPC